MQQQILPVREIPAYNNTSHQLEKCTTGLDIDISKLSIEIEQTYHVIPWCEAKYQMIIDAALKLTSIDEPDWRYFAGRIYVLDLYEKVTRNRNTLNLVYGNYLGTVKMLIAKGLYSTDLLEFYSEDEIERAGRLIVPEYDFGFDYAGVNLMMNRYLAQLGKNILELPQEAFMTIALHLNKNENSEIRLQRVKKTYDLLGQRKISLATPMLASLRKPNGNLSSCFIVSADDYLESIYYAIETCALISKKGGGVAVDWSRIRAKGSSIQGIPNASGGVTPWIKIVNDTAVAVNQQGKRAGAVTVALDIWHLDIEDFLEMQTENGDQRRKSFDVFPQVVVCDEFMRAVEDHQEWYMFDPYEIRTKTGHELAELWGETFSEVYRGLVALLKSQDENTPNEKKITLYKKIEARSLLKQIMRTQLETGMPYISFKDTINEANPNKRSGYIPCVNLCVESFSNVKPAKIYQKTDAQGRTIRVAENGENHTCNLLSLNLASLLNEEEIEEATREAVRILDNSIDLTDPPVYESKIHNQKYRTVGLGVMGYADHIAYHSVMYEQSAEFADGLFERISYYALDESANLAKERGAFELYEKSEFARGLILGKNANWFARYSLLNKEWEHLFNKIQQFGIRNSQVTAIAPNTSSALVQGATASILPVFSKFFIDDNAKGMVPVIPPFIKERFWYYKEFKNIDQKKLINVISKVQKWIDTGISMELIFNLNNESIDALYIFETILEAWKKKCKAIYYVRSIQKDGSIQSKEECVSCAG